jgi:hypothetical protein
MRPSRGPGLVGWFTLATLGFFAREAAADGPACTTPKTTCSGSGGYYASSDDLNRLTAVADPILRDVRTCLDGAGGKHVPSVLVIRWDSDGKAVDVRIDAPGYESLPCVQKAQTKLANLQNPHETAIRCEFGCNKPQPPPLPPPSAPVATAPAAVPPPTTAAPAATAPATQQPPAPVAPPPRYEKVWYGYQTLIADAISIPLFAVGATTKTDGLTGAGYVGFALGAPVIHWVHGNVGKGFGSLGIRVGAPPTLALFGALGGVIADGGRGNTGDSALTGAWVGVGIGVAAAVVVDAAGFAYTKELVEPSTTPTAKARENGFAFSPTFDVRKDHATLGVAGTF